MITRELVAETVAPAAKISILFVLRGLTLDGNDDGNATVTVAAALCGLDKVAVTSAVCPSVIVSGVTTSVTGDCAEAGCATASTISARAASTAALGPPGAPERQTLGRKPLDHPALAGEEPGAGGV